jgi:hypothetical protein
MARKQSHNRQSPDDESQLSDWFRHNYPDVTLGDMANYYRSMQESVPFEEPETDGYAQFYERMSGRPLDEATDTQRPGRFHHLARYAKLKRRSTILMVSAVALLVLASIAVFAWVQWFR